MSASSERTTTLKKIQDLLEELQLTVKEPYSIRWLGLKNAVEAVYESYNSVLATLSKFAVESPVAKGLYKYFKSYKVALLVAVILDIHTELGILSQSLQRKNLLFSEVRPMIEGTAEKILFLESNDGSALKEMKDLITVEDGKAKLQNEELSYSSKMDGEFQSLRVRYIKNMHKNMKSRFKKEDYEMFEDFSVLLEPVSVASAKEGESENALAQLSDFFGTGKSVSIVEGDLLTQVFERKREVPALLDSESIQKEWPILKGMIKGGYSKFSTEDLCKRIIIRHNDMLPNFALLANIALCLQVTSVECERSFSAQNRLKTKFRSSTKSERLDILLKIHMVGPPLTEYDPSPSIRLWLAKKRRRKIRLAAPYKPRLVTKSKKQKTVD